jgi:urease accessory protein
MVNKRLAVIQMMDTTFPIGLFNQSFGFEYFIHQNKITDDQSFYHWLRIYMEHQLQYNDLLIVQELFHELSVCEEMPVERIVTYNDLLNAQNLAAEVRMGNSRTGSQFLNLVIQLFNEERLQQLKDALIAHNTDPHPATVYAVTGYILKMSLSELLETYLYGVISSLIQNAVRGIPIGQTKAQKMLISMHDEIARIVDHVMELSIDDFGKGLPGYEIAQMQHETLFARMFMS